MSGEVRGYLAFAVEYQLVIADQSGAEAGLAITEIVLPFSQKGRIASNFNNLVGFFQEFLPPQGQGAGVVVADILMFAIFRRVLSAIAAARAPIEGRWPPGKTCLRIQSEPRR